MRPLFVARIEGLLEEVAGSGPPPAFVARDVLEALDATCREAGCVEAIDALLDATRAEDATDAKVTRRIVPGLTKLGTYEGGRWTYPGGAPIVALVERILRIEWIDEPEPAIAGAPPAGVVPAAYGPDVPLGKGAWIAHPKLGVGRVLEASGDRIRVRFEDRERTLLHRAIASAPRVEAMSEDVRRRDAASS